MPVSKEEVYHLKNWEFLIDYMCSSPKMAQGDILEVIQKTFNLEHQPEIDINIIKECSCVRTREGLETCLLLQLEGRVHAFFPNKMQENFDKFLKNLDDEIGKWKELWYDYHSV